MLTIPRFRKVKIRLWYQIVASFFVISEMEKPGGGSRIFSRGGGADFQKIFENFFDLLFRSTKLIFRALPLL